MLRKLPGKSAHAVTRLLRGHRHSSRTSLHQYVQKYTLYTCFEISAQGTLLLDHALCLLLWESGGQGSGKSLCMCVV